MAAHISLTRPAMPRLRPYAPRDWAQFTALELETQLDSLGDSTEEERAIFRERFPALLDVKMGFSRNGFRRPGAQLWVLEGDDGRYLGHLWLTERDDALDARESGMSPFRSWRAAAARARTRRRDLAGATVASAIMQTTCVRRSSAPASGSCSAWRGGRAPR